jgi:tellurite resistance protein TehA-like permease
MKKIRHNIFKIAERFSAAYFAFTMATGIVSIAAYLMGMNQIAWLLFQLNKAAFILLLLLLLSRLIYFPLRLVREITAPDRGPAAFTVVAGTCLLGSQFIILSRDYTMGSLHWIAGSILWFFLIYAFFFRVIVQQDKPAIVDVLDGGWLIYVVGTQSISVLGSLVAVQFIFSYESLFIVPLVMYLLGSMLYIVIIVLLFYRLVFLPISDKNITPVYWINMGAGAITTLSGATLLKHSDLSPLLHEIVPFLKGMTLFYWAFTTWWIPLLLLLTAWRFSYERFRITYNVQYWSMVFPLGMYAVCTFHLGNILGIPILSNIASIFFYFSIITWGITFLGMSKQIVSIFSQRG